VIKHKQPSYFILENVKGIISVNDGKTFDIILHELNKLGKYGYKVHVEVLNTRDYGIPQNRERVFFVGTKYSFELPRKLEMKPIEDFVDYSDKIKRRSIPPRAKRCLKKIPNKSIFIDLSRYRDMAVNSDKYCQTIRVCGTLWNVPFHRNANANEKMMLQGFDPSKFKVVISRAQIHKQLGNTMSVNVLKAILKNLI
jgi:DNA (cytosine-5)-methyltransferase 1